MSNNNTILTPITNLVSNTTQKSGTTPCTEYNTYHIDQNWNICTSGTKTLRFEVPRKMIFLIEADQLSHTSIPNINLNTNARELNVYNPRCINPSHILVYDGIWWISNFRSKHKDVEMKQIRKITNSKKIPLTIVSNPDRAKKIRQVLHQAGVRVCDKPIANTIQ